jgi:hypothetical protein
MTCQDPSGSCTLNQIKEQHDLHATPGGQQGKHTSNLLHGSVCSVSKPGVAVDLTGGRSDCQSEAEETDMIRMAVRRPAWGALRGAFAGLQNGRIRTDLGRKYGDGAEG